jgi:hypothetical protein
MFDYKCCLAIEQGKKGKKVPKISKRYPPPVLSVVEGYELRLKEIF